MSFLSLLWVGGIGFVISYVGFLGLLWVGRIGIVVGQVFDLFSFVFSYLFSCSRGWKVVFVDLCVVLINLWDSFSQVRSSAHSVVAQGVPVIGVGVEVFVYPFALLGCPSFFFTESEERVSSAVGWIVFVDLLDPTVVLCKAKTSCVQVKSALFNWGKDALTSTSRDEFKTKLSLMSPPGIWSDLEELNV